MRLLIIEDEEGIATPLKAGLERRNFAVDVAYDGEHGLREAKINQYDCILLDLNLPGMDGLQVARNLRDNGNSTPILMLTARDLQKNIWEGFESGADDYLTKPFDFVELVYRVNALIKRNVGQIQQELTYKTLKINTTTLKVTVNDKDVELNKKEYGILEYLLRKQGQVISSEELLEHVWDANIDGFSQTVRTNIKTLRKKVDPDKKLLHTLRGYGYKIE